MMKKKKKLFSSNLNGNQLDCRWTDNLSSLLHTKLGYLGWENHLLNKLLIGYWNNKS